MEYILILIVAALVFGICFLIDKGFTKLFRSQAEHMSGTAVRLSKRYGDLCRPFRKLVPDRWRRTGHPYGHRSCSVLHDLRHFLC